jgi:hypothetical protein
MVKHQHIIVIIIFILLVWFRLKNTVPTAPTPTPPPVPTAPSDCELPFFDINRLILASCSASGSACGTQSYTVPAITLPTAGGRSCASALAPVIANAHGTGLGEWGFDGIIQGYMLVTLNSHNEVTFALPCNGDDADNAMAMTCMNQWNAIAPTGSLPTPTPPPVQSSPCIYEWTDTVCNPNTSTMIQTLKIISQPIGTGQACPSNKTKTISCTPSIDCSNSEWVNVGSCVGGSQLQSRTVNLPQNNGLACTLDQTISSRQVNCGPVNCDGNFGTCTEISPNVYRKRYTIVTDAENGGQPCPYKPDEYEGCDECPIESTFGPFGGCKDNVKTRTYTTTIDGMKIYEISVGKFRLAWS